MIIFISSVLVILSIFLLANYSSADITGYAPYSDANAVAIQEQLEREPLSTYIQEASTKFSIDINLIRAIISQESSGSHLKADGTVKHSQCCWGIMQVSEGAFKDIKSQIALAGFDEIKCPAEDCIRNNIMAGTAYLKLLRNNYCNGNIECTIASYYGGPNCRDASCRNYNYATTIYLPSVKKYYEYFSRTKFQTMPAINFKYYLKPSSKFEINYDFGIYEALKAQADTALEKVKTCFHQGGSPNGKGYEGDDKRYKNCAAEDSLIEEIVEEILEKEKKKEYVIKFKKIGKYKNELIEYKFAYIIEDKFKPPLVELQGPDEVIVGETIGLSWGNIEYLAYDTKKYYLFYYTGGIRGSRRQYSTLKETGVSVSSTGLLGLGTALAQETTYCFFVIAEDNVGNKIDNYQDLISGVTDENKVRNRHCVTIKPLLIEGTGGIGGILPVT